MTIKFNKYNVTNGTIKARVRYSVGNHISGRECVWIYAKDFDRSLGKIFETEYKNETDSREDYFETGRVLLFNDHPLYKKAFEVAEKNNIYK
jgi:hypothetical protein